MNYFVKLGLVLLLITAIASGILAFVNSQTFGKIQDNKAKAEELARQEVLPDAKSFVENSVTLPAEKQEADPLKKQVEAGPRQFVYYTGMNSDNEPVGYTFVAARQGYSSIVKTMVGVTRELKIGKIKVIEQAETPGLGANATTDAFQGRFNGLSEPDLKVIKDGGKIQSLTGATITSRAVTNSIAEGLKILTEATGGEEE